jgi:hypothetical protein
VGRLPVAVTKAARVLPAGITVLLHAGAASYMGRDEQSDYRMISNGPTFRQRNTYLKLTGPMKAGKMLERLAVHASIMQAGMKWM